MILTPVDSYNDLYHLQDVVPRRLVDKINATDWINLAFTKEKYQQRWARRRILESELPWIDDWHLHFNDIWLELIDQKLQIPNAADYSGTAFWLDLPGFMCFMHTDGALPGSLHLMWIGQGELGTTFYNTPNYKDIRYQVPFVPNQGYIMINESNGHYHHLQWHAMMNPVPADSFRLTTYITINPR